MSSVPKWLEAARDHWVWRGSQRPAFAAEPLAGQESVWDYPRPPVIVADSREVIIHWGRRELARTTAALRVLETAHPPSFYLPLKDVDRSFLVRAGGTSFCEWKGAATYWSLVDGADRLESVGWSYPAPMPGADRLVDHIAFYPRQLRCTVGGLPVTPQAGGFYGGWVTPDLCGPFKGEPGSQSW